jgi:hypothetical protein
MCVLECLEQTWTGRELSSITAAVGLEMGATIGSHLVRGPIWYGEWDDTTYNSHILRGERSSQQPLAASSQTPRLHGWIWHMYECTYVV